MKENVTRTKVVILGNSGSAGRTFITLNLFKYLHDSLGKPVQVLGYDSMKQDLLSEFKHLHFTTEQIFAPFPKIQTERCRYCGICKDACTGNAIWFDKYRPQVGVNSASCYSCGECQKACTQKGITLIDKLAGEILTAEDNNLHIICSRLDSATEFEIPLIKVINSRIESNSELIADAGPGVTEANKVMLQAMDVAVIIQSPVENWKDDLQLMIDMCHAAKRAFLVVTNQCENRKDFFTDLEEYCKTNSIPFAGNIPTCFGAQENGALSNQNKKFEESIENIWRKIKEVKTIKSIT